MDQSDHNKRSLSVDEMEQEIICNSNDFCENADCLAPYVMRGGSKILNEAKLSCINYKNVISPHISEVIDLITSDEDTSSSMKPAKRKRHIIASSNKRNEVAPRSKITHFFTPLGRSTVSTKKLLSWAGSLGEVTNELTNHMTNKTALQSTPFVCATAAQGLSSGDTNPSKSKAIGIELSECIVETETANEQAVRPHHDHTLCLRNDMEVVHRKKEHLKLFDSSRTNTLTEEDLFVKNNVVINDETFLQENDNKDVNLISCARFTSNFSGFYSSKAPSFVPIWHTIPGTRFIVDYFNSRSRNIKNCPYWILTHFHSDHYNGLSRSWSQGILLGTETTMTLVRMRLKVPPERIRIIPLDEPQLIDGITITFIDANHCPGAAMVIAEFKDDISPPVLHTGDCRLTKEMKNSVALQRLKRRNPLLILDTTYCDPKYVFPSQSKVVDDVVQVLSKEYLNPRNLFVFGSYCIGKERLYLQVTARLNELFKEDSDSVRSNSALMTTDTKSQSLKFKVKNRLAGPCLENEAQKAKNKLTNITGDANNFIFNQNSKKCLIHCTTEKEEILQKCFEHNETYLKLITTDPIKSRIHVVPLFKISFQGLADILKKNGTQYSSIIGFRPTGWSFPKTESGKNRLKLCRRKLHNTETNENTTYRQKKIIDKDSISNKNKQSQEVSYKKIQRGNINLYEVPYSEHSSFSELKRFVLWLEPSAIIPSVNNDYGGPHCQRMLELLLANESQVK